MSKIILYIAVSLDGYIAKPDGNIDWLTTFPNPKNGDYGYEELLNSIDTIIMGSKTYNELIGFDIDWPYNNFKTYVISSNENFEIKSSNTSVLNRNFKEFIEEKKKTSSKNIWLVGGSEIIKIFLEENLIDNMIISKIPITIGDGIPLFTKNSKELKFELLDVKTFETGVVNLTYNKL